MNTCKLVLESQFYELVTDILNMSKCSCKRHDQKLMENIVVPLFGLSLCNCFSTIYHSISMHNCFHCQKTYFEPSHVC